MKKIVAALCIGIMTVAVALPMFGQMRGLNIQTPDTGEEIVLYQGSYALVIGASAYTEGWPSLPGVKADIEAVNAALETQGFEVTMIENPDHQQLQQAFTDFIGKYGQAPENRLLFYFAGHGHTLKLAYGGEMGYIVPVDAPNPNEDEAGFIAKALDMQMMEVYAKRIQAKHALFLFDSCFSGSLFSLSRAVPENISFKTAKPVRQFLTSGSAEEQVPDESIFRQQFVAALKGEADLNQDGYITGTELGEFLQDNVVNYSQGSQHPQYGKIRHPMLDKGDFVFKIEISATVTIGKATPPPATADAAASSDPEAEMWALTKDSTELSDVQDFLDAFPNGKFAKVARLKLKQLERQQDSGKAAADEEEEDEEDSEDIVGELAFNWAGDECWSVYDEDEKEVDWACGEDSTELPPGAYTVVSSGVPVFQEFDVTIEADKTTKVERKSGALKVIWPGSDCWTIFRGKDEVTTLCGTAEQLLEVGEYTVKPSFAGAFEPFNVTVKFDETTEVERSGLLDFHWPTYDCWKIFKGTKEIASPCGSVKQSLEVGTYTIKPYNQPLFEPFDVTINVGQTTTVQQGGVLEFTWPGNDCWTIYRGKQSVINFCGTAKQALGVGTYTIQPDHFPVFKPFDVKVQANQTTAIMKGGIFNFKWAGGECWDISRGSEKVAESCGAFAQALEPGEYVVKPNGYAVFAPFTVTIEENKTMTAQKGSRLEVIWHDGSCWTLLRQGRDAMNFCGSQTLTVEAGAYTLRPDAPSTLAAFEITVKDQPTTVTVTADGKVEMR